MNGNGLQLAPWLGAALVMLVLYFRLRRQFGRQLVKPVRLGVRIALLLVIGALLAPIALSSVPLALSAAGALAAGAALGAWAAAHTRLEQAERRVYYVPHAYAGMLVSALLIGRLGVRLAQLASGAPAALPSAGGAGDARSAALASSLENPLNLALLFVLVGYYLSYNGWLLWKSQRMLKAAAATSAPRAASSSEG